MINGFSTLLIIYFITLYESDTDLNLLNFPHLFVEMFKARACMMIHNQLPHIASTNLHLLFHPSLPFFHLSLFFLSLTTLSLTPFPPHSSLPHSSLNSIAILSPEFLIFPVSTGCSRFGCPPCWKWRWDRDSPEERPRHSHHLDKKRQSDCVFEKEKWNKSRREAEGRKKRRLIRKSIMRKARIIWYCW